MSSMVLTQVYLAFSQKKLSPVWQKKTGRKVSELMRDAVDTAIAGVTLEESQTLDMGTQRRQADISAMLGLSNKIAASARLLCAKCQSCSAPQPRNLHERADRRDGSAEGYFVA